MIVAFAVASAASRASADEVPIKLPERDWSATPIYRGAIFECLTAACGGSENTGIIALSDNFFSVHESEVNQAWFNPRAFVLGRVRSLDNRYHFKFVEFEQIKKTRAKDYASISIVGKANFEGKSYPLSGIWLFQGNHQTMLFSVAPTLVTAKRNLALALKSGDFRRKP